MQLAARNTSKMARTAPIESVAAFVHVAGATAKHDRMKTFQGIELGLIEASASCTVDLRWRARCGLTATGAQGIE